MPSMPISAEPSIEMLSAQLRDATPESQAAIGEDFEGMFVSLLLKEMRRTLDGGGLFPGDSSDAYGGLFDMYMGKELSKSGTLGIGRMVSSYLESAQGDGSTAQ